MNELAGKILSNFFLIYFSVATEVTTSQTPAQLYSCFRPESLSNSLISLYQDQNGVVAIYTCRHGYRFEGGGTTRTAVCIDGVWINKVDDCRGINHSSRARAVI